MSWSLIQTPTPTQFGGGHTSVTITFGSPVAAGDLVVVGVFMYGTTPSTVTDSAGNAYSQAATYASGNNCVSIYYSVVSTGGTLTITATPSGTANTLGLGAQEWSFASGATISVDGSAHNAGTGTSGTVGPVMVTGNDLCIAVMSEQGGNNLESMTAGSGFTLGYNGHGATNHQPIGTEFIANVTSSQTPNWTISTSVTWIGVAVTFLESQAGFSTGLPVWHAVYDLSNSRRKLWAD